MSKRVVNKIVAFTLIIATVVFFQGTGNSYADIPKTTTPNPTISNAVVKTTRLMLRLTLRRSALIR